MQLGNKKTTIGAEIGADNGEKTPKKSAPRRGGQRKKTKSDEQVATVQSNGGNQKNVVQKVLAGKLKQTNQQKQAAATPKQAAAHNQKQTAAHHQKQTLPVHSKQALPLQNFSRPHRRRVQLNISNISLQRFYWTADLKARSASARYLPPRIGAVLTVLNCLTL